MRATVVGSFNPSLPLTWSVVDHFSGDTIQSQNTPKKPSSSSSFSFCLHCNGHCTDQQTPLTASANVTVIPTSSLHCPPIMFMWEEAWCALLIDVAVEHANFTVTFNDDGDDGDACKPKDVVLGGLACSPGGSALTFSGMLASFDQSHLYRSVGPRNVMSWYLALNHSLWGMFHYSFHPTIRSKPQILVQSIND